MFGKETSQISLLHYLYYVKAGGGIDALLEATNGSAQEFSIKVSKILYSFHLFNTYICHFFLSTQLVVC